MPYETFVGLRHLKSKKKSFISTITLISILGVVVGVATLTAVVSVTGGFQEAFREKVLGINSHILVMKYGINFREYNEIIDTVEQVKGVEAASPFIFHEMMISRGDRLSGVLIKGIDPQRADKVSDLPRYVRHGTLDDLKWTPPPNKDEVRDVDPGGAAPEEDRGAPGEGSPDEGRGEEPSEAAPPEGPLPGIFLGTDLAEKLDAHLGDEVRLVSPLRGLDPGNWAPSSMAPTSRRFTVAGIYRSGFNEYDNKLVMVDYRALQDFFNQGDVVTGIEIRVADIFAVGEISEQIKGRLTPGRFRTLDWREINRNLFTSLKLQKLVLSIILTFIVIVASFNIVSTLIMLVLDKGKEIAIIKSMGASDGGIMRVFIFEGMIIGSIGTALGILGGLVACLIIGSSNIGMDPKVYLIDKLPVRIEPVEFLIVAIVSLLISFTATIYPAWRAATLSPVEGLRYD